MPKKAKGLFNDIVVASKLPRYVYTCSTITRCAVLVDRVKYFRRKNGEPKASGSDEARDD